MSDGSEYGTLGGAGSTGGAKAPPTGQPDHGRESPFNRHIPSGLGYVGVALLVEQRSRVMNAKERRTVANHECGHALVASLVPHGDPVSKISIIPRSRGALGYTIQVPKEDRYLLSVEELEDQVAIMMGTDCSPETRQTIDAEVNRIVGEQAARAGALLTAHRDALTQLAARALEAESVDGDEVREVLARTKPVTSEDASAQPGVCRRHGPIRRSPPSRLGRPLEPGHGLQPPRHERAVCV